MSSLAFQTVSSKGTSVHAMHTQVGCHVESGLWQLDMDVHSSTCTGIVRDM